MFILGLFWLSWFVFLFTLMRSPELQYYVRLSDIQATKSLAFSLVFVGLSSLGLLVFTSIGLTYYYYYYLESVALILTVLGSIFSLWVLQTGGCKWHKRKRNIT